MKNRIGIHIYLLILIFSNALNAQETNVKTEFTITGYCMVTDFKNNPGTTEWYVPEYASYETDKSVIEQIKLKNELNYTLTIVLGTWCSDSKKQVPRFIKILDESGFDYDNLNMICVDKQKLAAGIDLDLHNIVKVPTFIIYIDEEEAGRIIEAPAETLEREFINILNNLKR